MSDIQWPLEGRAFDGSCHISACPGQGMITVRADLTDPNTAAAVASVFGVALPGIRRVTFGAGCSALWMLPDEALLLCPYEEAPQRADELASQLSQAHALVVPVSDARAVFALKGSKLREVIAKLAPVDMSRQAFHPGMVRRTRLGQVPAAVWLSDAQTAHVLCFRSVAEYVFDSLCQAADRAAEVNHFDP